MYLLELIKCIFACKYILFKYFTNYSYFYYYYYYYYYSYINFSQLLFFVLHIFEKQTNEDIIKQKSQY